MSDSAASLLPQSTLSNLNASRASALSNKNTSKTREASEEFEAVFLHQMSDAMFETIEGGGTFGDSNASETWRGMLSEQYASAIVDAGGIGIADTVQRELIAMQEGSSL
ncbi:rod-binding protein [Breoghania sp.]|uniref:rod-binding protein n=1 Tax=Breoghania sp. TaxID=2065378 RepID=UPI00260333BD|nr:rod-binding protein [Breoghania sp.]MDJ0932101.1 rod-binding protein [Breoghania sp.]